MSWYLWAGLACFLVLLAALYLVVGVFIVYINNRLGARSTCLEMILMSVMYPYLFWKGGRSVEPNYAGEDSEKSRLGCDHGTDAD